MLICFYQNLLIYFKIERIQNFIMNLTKQQQFRIYQGEPFFKNSHLAHSILTYQNQQVTLCTNQSIFIFSLAQMVSDHAALINVISLQKIFLSKTQFCMDPITAIFNTSQKQKLGQKLFLNQNDVSTNILLKGQYLKQRLIYLNHMRVKHTDISSIGDLVIVLSDGQAIILKRLKHLLYLKEYQIIDLNKRVKQKIKSACFVKDSVSTILIHTYEKIILYDLFSDSQRTLGKAVINLKKCISIQAFCIVQYQKKQDLHEQQIVLILHTSHKIYLSQVVKKTLVVLDQIVSQDFIDKIFVYSKFKTIFYTTASGIFKILVSEVKHMQKPVLKLNISKSKDQKKQKLLFANQKICEYQTPQEAVFIDSLGNYVLKQKTTNKEYIHIVCETQNGFYLALTTKRNGNYKQGRIVIGSLSFNHFIKKLCLNIRYCQNNQFINCQDIKLLTDSKQKKQITHLVSSLYKQYNSILKQQEKLKANIVNLSNLKPQQFLQLNQTHQNISIFDIFLTQDQFQVLAINIGSIFEAKQSSKHKIIEKRLKNHFLIIKNTKQAELQSEQNNLQNLCCFTHAPIRQQDILECKCCSVYGVNKQNNKSNFGYKCYICFGKMILLQ